MGDKRGGRLGKEVSWRGPGAESRWEYEKRPVITVENSTKIVENTQIIKYVFSYFSQPD